MKKEQVEKGLSIMRQIDLTVKDISAIEEALKKEPVRNARYSDCYAVVNDFQINIPVEMGMNLLKEAKAKYEAELSELEKQLEEL